MLIVHFKPGDNSVGLGDLYLKSSAEEFLNDLSTEREVVINQVLMIDAIRAVLVENEIDPSHVVIEVYDENDTHLETVTIGKHGELSSWNNIPSVHLDFIKTVIMKKTKNEKN